MRWIVSIFLSLVISSSIFALTTAQLQAVSDAYLTDHRPHEHFTGLSITVMHQGKSMTVHSGTVSEHSAQPVSSENLYQAGSVAKSFLSALVLKVSSEPTFNISLDDPVSKYLPQYPKWGRVTLRHLLTMTSGIPDNISNPQLFSAYSRNPHQTLTIQFWLDHIYRYSLLFAPGSQFHYSNTNYLILKAIIEKVTHEKTEDLIARYFLNPLHLKHTYFVPDRMSTTLQKQLVHGYQHEQLLAPFVPLNTDISDFSLSYLNSAGDMITNSEDVATWIKALFTPGVVLSQQEYHNLVNLVSEADGQSIDHVSAQHPIAYGLGIETQYIPMRDTYLFTYLSMTLGYRCYYVYVPQEDFLLVVNVNSSFDHRDNHLINLFENVYRLVISNQLTGIVKK